MVIVSHLSVCFSFWPASSFSFPGLDAVPDAFGQPHIDLPFYLAVVLNQSLSSKATNNRTIACYAGAHFNPTIYGPRRRCGGVFSETRVEIKA